MIARDKNNNRSNNPVLIVGPTGVGKSEIAVALAQRVGGEILCGDAFQIYEGLEILTAQPSREQREKVPHHLFGALRASEPCDAARYLGLLEETVAQVVARGMRPLIVGGSGMYLKAFTHGLARLPAPEPALRKLLLELPLEELQARLISLDPAAAQLIDMANPRRVQRAVEILLQTGRPLAEYRAQWQTPAKSCSAFFLTRERGDLHFRIEHNIDTQFARGVVSEVESVRRLPAGETAMRAIGFPQICRLLDGEISEEICREQMLFACRQYARRQETWFRKQSEYQQILIGKTESAASVADRLLVLTAVGDITGSARGFAPGT